MGKWCPRCGAEYFEGWGECSICGIELVDSPPAPSRWTGEAITSTEPVVPDDAADDPFVPVWEGPTSEAVRLSKLVEQAHIPVDLGEATLAGHSRVEVPRSYVGEARDAMSGHTVSWPSAVARDPDLDWNPAFRLALVVVALGLIVLILLV